MRIDAEKINLWGMGGEHRTSKMLLHLRRTISKARMLSLVEKVSQLAEQTQCINISRTYLLVQKSIQFSSNHKIACFYL